MAHLRQWSGTPGLSSAVAGVEGTLKVSSPHSMALFLTAVEEIPEIS